MAIITGGIHRLSIKYPNIDIANVEFIGYGAGQHFKDFYPFLKDTIPLKYTLCPLSGGQGHFINGIEVKHPTALRQESKRHTVVVIFSAAFFNIMHDLRDLYGDFPCVRSLDFSNTNHTLSEIEDFRNIELSPPLITRRGTPRTGIFIQGMATEETPFVLAWNRMHHPHAYQCMATWDHLESDLLDKCRPWLDHLILTPQPKNPGFLYINSAMRSARLGVEHLASQGIEFAIRGRTDNLLTGSSHKVIDRHFSHGRNRGKIAIPTHDGWPHIPFMFGVNTMIARTEDMLNFWSMPEDPRGPDHQDFQYSSQDHFMKIKNIAPEAMWWSKYATHLGFSAENFDDSINFFYGNLLPLEPDWISISLKFIPLFNVASQHTLFYTKDMVEEIYRDPEMARMRAGTIQGQDMTIGDLFANRIG